MCIIDCHLTANLEFFVLLKNSMGEVCTSKSTSGLQNPLSLTSYFQNITFLTSKLGETCFAAELGFMSRDIGAARGGTIIWRGVK